LDCISVFTRDLDDAATVLDVLAGPDPDDPWSRPPMPPPPTTAVLAFPEALDFEGDEAMAAAFARVAARAASRARETIRIDAGPLREAGDLLYEGPWVAERLAVLEDFLDAHPDEVLPVTRTVIERGADFSAVDAFRARYRLQELRVWAAELFARADVLLLPTVPTTFTRAELVAQPVTRNLVLGRYTQFTNLLDLAAVAVPAGTTADGRPVGITLVGPAFAEARLLAAAARFVRP
jgi:allophanate hydrolase